MLSTAEYMTLTFIDGNIRRSYPDVITADYMGKYFTDPAYAGVFDRLLADMLIETNATTGFVATTAGIAALAEYDSP